MTTAIDQQQVLQALSIPSYAHPVTDRLKRRHSCFGLAGWDGGGEGCSDLTGKKVWSFR